MKIRNKARRCAALLAALSLLLSLAACGGKENIAATMHLRRTEGTVSVSDGDGKDVPVLEKLGLYSGYGVNTRSESYAWIDLDDVKLAKMDEKSEIAIQKEGKALDIEVKSGSLFFNVTEPLADDETMNIRTSTMLIGIRGTCGWVEVPDAGHMNVYLLEGKVECTVAGETATVAAGEAGRLDEAAGTVTVEPFGQGAIPAFVRGELGGISLDGIPETLEPSSEPEREPEQNPITDALAQYRTVIGQADTYDYGASPDGTISYQYALVRMQPGDAVPTLLLKKSGDGVLSELAYIRVFQYDPESGTMRQPANVTLSIGIEGTWIFSIAMMGDGNGLQASEWSRGTGAETVYRVTLEGGSLVRTQVWAGTFGDASEPASVLIDWLDIADLSGFDGWTPDADSPAQSSVPETLPSDGDRIVFTGTIGTYSYDEVLSLQGETDPNPGNHSGESFRLIVLDTPQAMGLSSVSDPGFLYERTVSMVAVSGLEQYDGQHLIFSIDPYQTYWPGDTSLPLGQPRTGDVHVLGTAP